MSAEDRPAVGDRTPGRTSFDHQDLEQKEAYIRIVNNFALSLIELTSAETLGWYVAGEVVGKFGFVDCVIYRLDEARGVLVQAAALGEKSPDRHDIVNYLEIPLGQGITGHVAQTKSPVIVGNLGDDNRYIPDIATARSEICVPLIHEGRILGVIDCEDPRPDYFTQTHLDFLTMIAAMTSTKIVQCEASERIQQQQHELEEALASAEHAQSALATFFANASHELRTPLNAIVGFSQLLTDEDEIRNNPEEAVQYGEYINAAGRHLARLVDDLLGISSLESGFIKPNLSRLDMTHQIRTCIAFVDHAAKAKNITLATRFATVPEIQFDKKHFKQILINLLDNAIKYSPEGSEVTVAIDVSDSGRTTVSVEDQGLGIALERQQEIFKPFTRDQDVIERDIAGVGLGLALALRLATANGAGLSVTSEPGTGSCFVLTLKD